MRRFVGKDDLRLNQREKPLPNKSARGKIFRLRAQKVIGTFETGPRGRKFNTAIC